MLRRRILKGMLLARFVGRICALAAVTLVSAKVTLAQPAAAQPPTSGTVSALYRQLGSTTLDPQRVYKVRDAALDRAALHVSFNDGTIAFMHDVQGHVTGAFFEGDGDVLVIPPTRVERTSLALFTDSPTLSEKFSTAFLRFNDDSFNQLKDGLRTYGDNAQDFLSRWDAAAQSLASGDALRLLISFASGETPGTAPDGRTDRFLHLRIGGTRHGSVDLYYDSLNTESVAVAQLEQTDRGTFLNVWTSFAPGASDRSPVVEAHSARGARSKKTAAAEKAAPAKDQPKDRDNDTMRISDYKIRARVLPPSELQCVTEFTVEAAKPLGRMLLFELSRFLVVSSAEEITPSGPVQLERVQNEALRGSQLARRGNDIIALILPQPLGAGQRVRLRLTYAGDVLQDAGGGLLYVGARGIWFPNRGFNQAKFDMEFRYPADWTLVATGTQTSHEISGGEQVAQWVSGQPIPTAGFNLGKYIKAEATTGGIKVAAYAARAMENNFPRPAAEVIRPVSPTRRVPPQPRPFVEELPREPTPAIRAEAVAKQAGQTLDWLSQRIGAFPYRSLEVTQMPGTTSQGFPGLIFLSSYVFLTPVDRERTRLNEYGNVLFGDLMVGHETAHQWWGDAVGWNNYHDVWLSEALANYSALMLLEQQKSSEFKTALDHYRADLLLKTGGDTTSDAGPVTLGQRLTSSKFPNGYERVVYGRGTWLLHMLRHFLRDTAGSPSSRRPARSGDDLFFAALRSLAEEHRFGRISNVDVQRAFEAVLPEAAAYDGRKTLDWFFEGWVNGSAIPRLELDDVKVTSRGSSVVATGKVLQNDAPEDLVTSVPIYAVAAAGQPVYVGRVFADGQETTFRFTVPPGTHKLLLDPYQVVLRQ